MESSNGEVNDRLSKLIRPTLFSLSWSFSFKNKFCYYFITSSLIHLSNLCTVVQFNFRPHLNFCSCNPFMSYCEGKCGSFVSCD